MAEDRAAYLTYLHRLLSLPLSLLTYSDLPTALSALTLARVPQSPRAFKQLFMVPTIQADVNTLRYWLMEDDLTSMAEM